MKHVCLLLLVLAASGCSRTHRRDMPSMEGFVWMMNNPVEEPPGELLIYQPRKPGDPYHCLYFHPADIPIHGPVVLMVLDEHENIICGASLKDGKDFSGTDDKLYEFEVGPAHIHRAYLALQIHPGTVNVDFVQVPLGKQNAIRKEGEKFIREPIPPEGDVRVD